MRKGRCPIRMSQLFSRSSFRAGLVLCLVLSLAQTSIGYSVLTHEEIIDLLWADHIKKLLLKRFPDATDDQLREAHAYAYGGFFFSGMGCVFFSEKKYFKTSPLFCPWGG